MNERLVNIVKRRVGGVRGPTRAGWARRDMKNGEIRGGVEYMCTRVHVYAIRARCISTRSRPEFNVCVTAGRSRNGGGGGAEIYIMFIMLT